MDLLTYIADRMKEASSYGGAAAILLAAMHISASPDTVNAVLGVVAAVGGLIAIIVKEKAAPPADPDNSADALNKAELHQIQGGGAA